MSQSAPEARYALNLILDAEDQLLLLKRSLSAGLGPGQWGLPAGKIEPGESAEAAWVIWRKGVVTFCHSH